MNTVHPLTPVSDHLGLNGIHTTPSEVGQWSGGARKRKRETSLNQMQQSPFGSPAARSMPTLHEQYYSRPWKSRRNNPISSSDGGGYMSDSPAAAYRSQRVQQRREQTHSGSFLDRSGYEADQPPSPSVVRARPGSLSRSNAAQGSSSSDRMTSSLLQPPPAPVEGSQRMYDKVASFLQDMFMFMEDTMNWNEFSRVRAVCADSRKFAAHDARAMWRCLGYTGLRRDGLGQIATLEASEQQESPNCVLCFVGIFFLTVL